MTTLARVYPGANATFNLVLLERFKKNGTEVSEFYENELYLDEDDDAPLHLITRLMWTNGAPWLIVHYGSTQVLNAPLILPSRLGENGKTVTLKLREYSNRSNRFEGGLQADEQCIRRLFRFTFSEAFEACAFRVCHNIFLKAMTEPHVFEDDEAPPTRPAPPAPVPDPPAPPAPPVPPVPVLAPPAAAINDEYETEEESFDLFLNRMDISQGDEENGGRQAIFDGADSHTFEDDAFDNTQGFNPDSDDSFF